MWNNLIIIVFLTGLIGLIVFLYIKERKTPGYKLHSIFRLIVLILLILVIIANIFRFSYEQSPKIPVLVLVDASKSINIGGNISKIREVVNKISKESFGKKFYSFTDSIGPIERYEKAEGKRTDISEVLSFAKTKRPGAIILISDGLHNVNTDPMAIVQNIQAPIYTIGLGDEQKQDISIQSIRKPIRTFLGDTVEIIARIQNKGFENYSTKVNLWQKGKNIESKNITFLGGDVIQEVNFKTVPETTGKISYILRLDTLPKEVTTTNNRKDFSIEILKSRWNVIYLTNSPSFNTRFIIATLENANPTEPKSTNTFTVIPMIAFIGANLEILKEMSVDQAFKEADVIILDDINGSYLNNDLLTRIRNLTEQGKGLLILVGENFKSQGLLNEISPFDFNVDIQKKNIFIELTEAGAATPIFFSNNGEFLLDNPPPLYGIIIPQYVKPEATIWAVAQEDNYPLIGFRQYKNSKIVGMNGFPLWRLGFSVVETEHQKQKFEQFLKNLIRFLAIKEFERFKLVTDKPDYLSGEDIIFNLLATTPDGRCWTDLDIKVEVPSIKYTLPLYEYSPGNYEGNAQALAAGEYEANAMISKDDKPIGNAKTTFSVTQQSIEDITGLNTDLLNKLSNATGGKYYSTNSFLNETFIPKTIKYKRTLSFSFHNNPYIYIIITALFGILLFLRKKRGFL